MYAPPAGLIEDTLPKFVANTLKVGNDAGSADVMVPKSTRMVCVLTKYEIGETQVIRVSLTSRAAVVLRPEKPHVKAGVSVPRAEKPAPSTVRLLAQEMPVPCGLTVSNRITARRMEGKSRYGVAAMALANRNL